jgi:LacI family transcriptional regulator
MRNQRVQNGHDIPDIHRVASEAGVSIATVSRALHNPDRVNPDTRERVLEVARSLGYQPNHLGQRLRKGKAELVGVVLPTPAGQFGTPFFLELLAGLGEGFEQSGLELIVTSCPPGPAELKTYQRLVEGRRVDALIVPRTRRVDERILYLLDRDVPFVAHGRSQIDRVFPFLDMDAEHGFLEAGRELVRLGHTRIGLINAPMDLNLSHHRLAGYRLALEESGLPFDQGLIVSANLDEPGGHDAAERLLGLPVPPTAILCANDMTAFGVMHALAERGLRVGRDVSVIGYDDVPLARFSAPPLSTLRQPARAAGRRLAHMLLERLRGVPVEDLCEVWQPELILRKTHGTAPNSGLKQEKETRKKSTKGDSKTANR